MKSIRRKALLIQALFGAITLTLLMHPMDVLGYKGYLWMLFLAVVLYFSAGPSPSNIPKMIVSFMCGVAWATVNGILMGVLSGFPAWVPEKLLTVVIIFGVLTVHENFLSGTVAGHVPSLFLGLSQTFCIFTIQPVDGVVLSQVHLVAFFLYGLFMASIMVIGGGMLCNTILGKDWPVHVYGKKAS